jgi:hypothetical protein
MSNMPKIENTTFSKKVRRMFSFDLDTWNTVLIISSIIGLFSGATVVLSQREIIKLQKVTAIESAKEIADAKAHSSEANLKAEQLRTDNLALQKIIQPRRLGSLIRISSPNSPDIPPEAELQFSGIKKFIDTPVVIQVVPDFEAQALARDMVSVLIAYGWKPVIINEARSHVSPMDILDGVRVTYPPGSKFVDAARALADGFTNAGLTGGGLNSCFAQGYPVTRAGKPVLDFPGYPSFDPPIDAVIVQVGMKPIPSAKADAQKQ